MQPNVGEAPSPTAYVGTAQLDPAPLQPQF